MTWRWMASRWTASRPELDPDDANDADEADDADDANDADDAEADPGNGSGLRSHRPLAPSARTVRSHRK
jgi:hypothetical protein